MLIGARKKRTDQPKNFQKKKAIKNVEIGPTYLLSSTHSTKPFSFDISNILGIHWRFNTYEVEDLGTAFAAYKFSNSSARLTIIITLHNRIKTQLLAEKHCHSTIGIHTVLSSELEFGEPAPPFSLASFRPSFLFWALLIQDESKGMNS